MKKSAKLKRKTIKLIVKNLIVFAVLIAVVTVGVRSWFDYDSVRKADAKGLTNVVCSVPEGLEVAVLRPGESVTASTVWHNETFVIDPDSAEFSYLGALSFTEISGDGKSFIKPKIKQYGSVAVVDTSDLSTWATAAANSEYLSLDMVFRTTASTATVVLDSESTYCGPESSTQTWGDNTNGWSPHTVIGAARVSVVDYANLSSSTRSQWQKLLWIPAPFLHFDPIERTGDAQLLSTITQTNNQYGLVYYDDTNAKNDSADGTYNHGFVTNTGTHTKIEYSNSVTNANTKVTANPSILAADKYHLPYDVTIANLDTNHTYDSVQYKEHRVRLNIWIEGEDPESRAAQVTGKFKTVLSLKLGQQTP